LYNRITLTIYGWEFHDQLRPFHQYAKAQGNDMTFFVRLPTRRLVEQLR
jgi:hypothetical protein